MRVRYSREAISDLRMVREFIEEKNPQAARRVAALLMKGINQLKSFPGLGTEVHLAFDPEVIRVSSLENTSLGTLSVIRRFMCCVSGTVKKIANKKALQPTAKRGG